MQISLLTLLLTLTEALPQPNGVDALFDRFLAPVLSPFPFRPNLLASQPIGLSHTTHVRQAAQEGSDAMSDREAMALIDSMNPLFGGFAGLMEKLRPAFFDPLALLPGLENKFDLLPNVTISDAECLVTVNINGLDMNTTSIRVYSSRTDVSVEITKTQSLLQADTAEPSADEAESTNEEDDPTESEQTLDLDDIKSLFNLRGAQSAVTSSFTTIRSFPAPEGCDMTSEKSKATVDEKEGNLLLKFPKIAEEGESAEATDGAQLVEDKDLPEPDSSDDASVQAIVRSALAVNDMSPTSWLRNLFGRSSPASPRKVPVPIVRYDEF